MNGVIVMQAIVAIGGGEISLGETRVIDEYIVSLSEALMPRVLFIPTASGDAPGYIDCFTRAYADLGCRVDTLRLYGSAADTDEMIASKFRAADIVYVGGGDTEMMLNKWHARGVDALLRDAYDRGVILSGLSAGALCWFAHGMTDPPVDDELVPVWMDGLNLIPLCLGVHYDEPYWQQFDGFAAQQSMPAVALENCVALSVIDGRMTIVRSRSDRRAWLLRQGIKTVYEGGRID